MGGKTVASLYSVLMLLIVILSSCNPNPTSKYLGIVSVKLQPALHEMDPRPLVTIGRSIQLSAIAYGAVDNIVEKQRSAFNWYTTPKSSIIATVDSDGLALGLSPGTVTINAEIKTPAGPVIGTILLVVTPDVISVVLKPASQTVEVGGNRLFQAIAVDAKGTQWELPASAFNWSAYPERIAVVDKSGFVEGIAPGEAVVSAFIETSEGGCSGTAFIHVVPAVSSTPTTSSSPNPPATSISTSSPLPPTPSTSSSPTQSTTTSVTTTTPARDLTGTWKGTGIYYYMDNVTGLHVMTVTIEVTLKITQTGNTVTATMNQVVLKQDPPGWVSVIDASGNEKYALYPAENWSGPLQGTVSSTTVTMTTTSTSGYKDQWQFTFTVDLMRGGVYTQQSGAPYVCKSDPNAFSLVRQQ